MNKACCWAVAGLLVVFAMLSGMLALGNIGLSSKLDDKEIVIDDLESDIKDQKDYIDDIQNDVDYWRDKYDNFEPKIVTETEYIWENRTFWINETIYIDNAIFDVNRDGTVDYYDACEVLYYINKGVSRVEDLVFLKYGNPYEKLYDVTRDGTVNVEDVDAIWNNCDN